MKISPESIFERKMHRIIVFVKIAGILHSYPTWTMNNKNREFGRHTLDICQTFAND